MLRQLNAALQKSEERFHLMMESLREDEFFIMDKDGYIISWIARRDDKLNYTAEETVGQHFSVFSSRDDFQSGKPMRILERAERDGRYEEDGWRIRKDGSRARAYVIVVPMKDQAGNLLGFSNTTRYLPTHSAQPDQRDNADPKRQGMNGPLQMPVGFERNP
jgi:PAS domain S-box-containing protein